MSIPSGAGFRRPDGTIDSAPATVVDGAVLAKDQAR
jgi:hypothetical protein